MDCDCYSDKDYKSPFNLMLIRTFESKNKKKAAKHGLFDK